MGKSGAPTKKEKSAKPTNRKNEESRSNARKNQNYAAETTDDDEEDVDSCFSGEDSGSDSTDSENDYSPHISFVDLNGVSEKLVANAWVRQRGLCRISGMPMSGKTGLYSPIASLRVFKNGVKDGNVIVVCRVIYEMRNATTLPWKQFAQLMKVFGDQIGSDYRF